MRITEEDYNYNTLYTVNVKREATEKEVWYLLKNSNFVSITKVLYITSINWMSTTETRRRLLLSILILFLKKIKSNVVTTIKFQFQKFCKRVEESVS